MSPEDMAKLFKNKKYLFLEKGMSTVTQALFFDFSIYKDKWTDALALRLNGINFRKNM